MDVATEAEDDSPVRLRGSRHINQARERLVFSVVLAKEVYNPHREEDILLYW